VNADEIKIVIPAAGKSARFGDQNKLLKPVGERSVLASTIEMALSVGASEVIVVLGHEADQVFDEIRQFSVRCVVNPEYAEGMASSIRFGVAAAGPMPAVMIWPGDMPRIQVSSARTLIAYARPDRIVVPSYRSQPGHPVLFGNDFIPELLEIGGTGGARGILSAHPEQVVRVELEDSGIAFDIDRPGDLDSWIRQSREANE
jgi:molybdenum cofactor cytidylyltransferase